jgi:hypothetical protein
LARERGVAAAAAKITSALASAAFEGDAHALLMAVYKDTTQPVELRLEAARAAIGYEKPRLAAVNANVSGGLTLGELVLASMKLREGGAAVTPHVKMGHLTSADFHRRFSRSKLYTPCE